MWFCCWSAKNFLGIGLKESRVTRARSRDSISMLFLGYDALLYLNIGFSELEIGLLKFKQFLLDILIKVYIIFLVSYLKR